MLPPYVIRLVSKTKELYSLLLAASIKPQNGGKVKSKKEIRIFPGLGKNEKRYRQIMGCLL